jgi:hypothetical protein
MNERAFSIQTSASNERFPLQTLGIESPSFVGRLRVSVVRFATRK